MEAFFYLVLLGVLWVVAILVAVAAARQLRGTLSRACVVSAGVISVPLYFWGAGWYGKAKFERNEAGRQAVAVKSAALYAELCARPQELSVEAALMVASPVDVQIQEEPGTGSIKLMEPKHPKRTVCWAEPKETTCPKPPIRNVQWEFRSDASWCKTSNTEGCYRAWNYSVAEGSRTDISSPTAPFVLKVTEEPRVASLVKRYRVALIDARTSVRLGQTYIYRKSFFDGLEKESGISYPSHCPNKEVAVATLLHRALVLQR